MLDPHFDSKNGILKNVPGIIDQNMLEDFERIQATKAIVNLRANPVQGVFDSAHLKEIHRRIFQNIYPWAGEFRQVNIRRSASFFFALVQFMEMNLKGTLTKLGTENHLKGLNAAAFASRAAYYLGELNAIHPFREGNGRTQREFIRELAAEAGHRLNWSRVSHEQMYVASIESHNVGKNDAFATLILSAVEPALRL
jgi:cell filamentation protein